MDYPARGVLRTVERNGGARSGRTARAEDPGGGCRPADSACAPASVNRRLRRVEGERKMTPELRVQVDEHESFGCVQQFLGAVKMPKGYALMLNADYSHYYYVHES